MSNAIELRHLRYFMALAEELHFGRAAKRCNISQPPFSVAIRQLEDGLGFSLVERSTHEVRLTAAGAVYYREASKTVTQFERAQHTAGRASQGLTGTLEVGFFASMLHRGLDRAVRAFNNEHPEVSLRLSELSTSDQIPALLRHRIQYGFVHSATLPEAVMSEELLREPFVLCLPAQHSAANRELVALSEFRDEPFILFARSFSPTYYDQVVSICVSAGFHPNIHHEARHWLTVLACVSKGMGITLVPRSLIRTRHPEVAFVPLSRSPIESVVYGAWLKSESGYLALHAWHRMVCREVTT